MSIRQATDRGTETRERLLAAASALFPERGFRDATTLMICRRARANVASVNYHFGSKSELYVAVWKSLLATMFHPRPDGDTPEAPVEPTVRLRWQIRRILGHMTQEGALGRLMLHELVRPTGLIDGFRRDALARDRRRTRALLGELLGPSAAERDIALCELSVVNQCLALRMEPMLLDDLQRGSGGLDLDELADHITRFSLGGIRAARRRCEA